MKKRNQGLRFVSTAADKAASSRSPLNCAVSGAAAICSAATSRRAASASAGDMSPAMISSARSCSAASSSIVSAAAPSAAAIRRSCWRSRSPPGTPGPARSTAYAMVPGSTRLSASGATRPPSEMPIRPTRSGSIRSWPRRKRTPNSTSLDLSREVDCQVLPVDPPTPRSSTRSTATPSRVRWSASTRNGLWPASSRSRFRAPLPLISSAAGTLPSPGGKVSVPAIFTSRLAYSTSSAS